MVAVALEHLTVRYGSLTAIDNLTFAVGRGQTVGIIGPNGSGKSTTLAAIAGLLDAASGKVFIDGLLRSDDPAEYARRIGYVPQEPALYEELTALENLDFIASLYDYRRQERRRRRDKALDLVGLRARSNDRVATLSGGMKQRLSLAAALLHDPLVVLLDEPSVALDPTSRDICFQTIADIRESGRAILFSTHHLDEAEQWCDYVIVLRKGILARAGKPSEVMMQHRSGTSVHGMIHDNMTDSSVAAIRERLGPDVEFAVTGRRIRLSAPDAEQLGLAIAALGTEGVQIESLRTPTCQFDTANETQAAEMSRPGTGGIACFGN